MKFQPDANYTKHEKEIAKLDALRSGAEAVKTKAYLPQLEREEGDSYKTRQEQTILTNYTEKTVNAAKGLIFRKPLAHENTKLDVKNVDSEGQTLNRFGQDVLESGLWHGHACIMVDAPSAENITTLEEERQAGLLPYFSIVERKNILSFKTKFINGKVTLIEIVIKEITQVDGEDVNQYRVLKIGSGEIWREIKGETVLVTIWESKLDYIPITTFYTRRRGILLSKPMFTGIADLNIRHLQEDSMSWRIKAYAGNPILKIWGMLDSEKESGEGEEVTMSVNSAFRFSHKEEGDAQWLVYEGKELALFERSMANIEQKIAMLGLSMLSSKDESKELTATEKNIDSEQENADLLTIAQNLEDALNEAERIYCDMAGETKSEDDNISVNRDFVKELLTPAEVKELREQYTSGLLDKASFWQLMNEGGWFKNIDLEKLKANVTDGNPEFAD